MRARRRKGLNVRGFRIAPEPLGTPAAKRRGSIETNATVMRTPRPKREVLVLAWRVAQVRRRTAFGACCKTAIKRAGRKAPFVHRLTEQRCIVMTASEIRTELLGQHQEIRLMIETTREAARRTQSDTSARSDLSACTVRLAHCIRTHNRREEEVLRELLRTIDAWGPERVQIMEEQHAG